jgi:hypothetical protein
MPLTCSDARQVSGDLSQWTVSPEANCFTASSPEEKYRLHCSIKLFAMQLATTFGTDM